MTLHFVGDVLMFAMRYLAAREGAVAVATGSISIAPVIVFAAFAAVSVLLFRMLARQTRTAALPIPAIA